ncbi:hypothetical protein [Streptomyces sp. NPDC101178]|uniref:hypothetical protein n=1 Tax=Streptomyces sp. NPDC101178 TaxID=3366124 RepID=UPI00380A6803
MTVHQQALDVGTFAHYLRELTARLDPGRGWYGVFTRRDPQGMRSCLDGVEIPPWDVVESLLADLAALHGAYFAEQASVRAAALYSAAAAAHDRRPGGRQELVHRLELMIREQSRTAERLRAAEVAGAGPADSEVLAWAQDDHRRAAARCAELRGRLAAVTVPHPRVGASAERGAVRGAAPEPVREPLPGLVREPVQDFAPQPAPAAGGAEALGRSRPRGPAAGSAPAPAPRRKKPRGARFAGLDVDDEEETGYAPSAVPVLPVPAPEGGSAPRGARFGGVAEEAEPQSPASAELPDQGTGEAVAAAVARLVRLRAEGRGGEAHVVLCEVAAWPAPRLPVLAVALYRAGLAADWTTLLWEASSLPPAAFASAAGALAAAGREEDCGLLLRQGVARPAAEVAEAVLALDGAGRESEARALLGAFVRVRTPQEAAELAGGGGDRVLPHLLAAAREASVEREWDLVHALRVAGVPGV